MTLQELIVKVSTDLTGLKTEDATAKFAKMGSDIDGILGGIGGKIAAGLSLAGVAAAAIHGAETYEQALLRIQRATGTTGNILDALGESFKNVYSKSAASAEQVTQALTLIYQRTGQTGDALEDFTLKLLKLAKVSGEDVKSMGEAVTAMFANWKMGAEQQGNSLNYLTALFQKTGVSVTETAAEVSKYGVTLRALGYDFDSAAALIAKFAKEGVNTQAVIVGMKAELARFKQQGITDTAKAWADFVKGVQDGSITMATVIAQVGKRGGSELFAAIRDARTEVTALTKETEAAAKSTATSGTSMTAEWTKLKHSIEMALEPLGAPFLAVLSDALSGVAKFTQQAGKLLKDFTDSQKRAAEDKDLPWYGQSLGAFLGAGAAVASRVVGGGQTAPTAGAGGAGAGSAAAAAMKQEQEAADALSPALQTLVEKHKELNDAVIRARDVFTEAQKAYAAGKISAQDLTAAHDALKKAIEAAKTSMDSHLLSVSDLLEKQRNLNNEVTRAQAIFDAIQRLYDAGRVSLEALVRAQEQLDTAIKAASGSAVTWQNVYRGIIADQEKGSDTAYATARAYLEIVKNFAAGSATVIEAHNKMDAALKNTGTTGIQMWRRLVEEAGGYVVTVINGGVKTEQAIGLTVKQAEALNAVLAAVQGKSKDTTDTMTGGFQKVNQVIDAAGNTVEVLTMKLNSARGASGNLANAIDECLHPLDSAVEAVDNFNAGLTLSLDKWIDINSAIKNAAKGVDGIRYDMAKGNDTNLSGAGKGGSSFGWSAQSGQFQLMDPAHPEQGGWLLTGSTITGLHLDYFPPYDLSPTEMPGTSSAGTTYGAPETIMHQIDTTGIPEAIASLGDLIVGQFDRLIGFLQNGTDQIAYATQQVVDTTTGAFEQVTQAFSQTVTTINAGMTDLGNALRDTVTAAVATTAEAVFGAITGDLQARAFIPGSMDMPVAIAPGGAGTPGGIWEPGGPQSVYDVNKHAVVQVYVYDRSGADSVVQLIQERL